MKEIKFRAWVPEVSKMIPWEYLNLELEDGYGGVKDNSVYDVLKDIENQVTSHFELMQFTGLKDKNGKEIYEGDIVRYEWDDEVKIDFIELRGAMFTVSKVVRWNYHRDEVIGNIYENPELLEVTS